MEEDSPYSDLKNSLSAISVKALNYSSRLRLANNLDHKQPLLSDAGFSRDYRGLAELIGFQYYTIKRFEESENRTMKILESWETLPDATLDKLISYLELMERHDIIRELIPSLQRNVKGYLDEQKSLESPIQVAEVSPGPTTLQLKNEFITRHDKGTGECTIYDAYVSYAEEDTPIAREFASVLESPQYRLKLFISGRDMLAGCLEMNTNIELIKNRCRHMLIILTPNFMRSPALEFQVSFAGTLAIEQKQRILIPVILSPCEMPPILNSVSKIDFTKGYTYDWMMDKLVTSLLPEDRIFLSSNARITRGDVPNSICAAPVESRPVITFPPSGKHSLSCVSNSNPVLSITLPSDMSDDDNKDSDASSDIKETASCSDVKEIVSSPPKQGASKKFERLMLFLKRKGNSTSVSSASLSSSATSGFHSQSYSSIKSFTNSGDHDNDDTSL